MPHPVSLRSFHLQDPDGHKPSLLLKGDWLILEITDGQHTGQGDGSHTGNDPQCIALAQSLFNQHVLNKPLTLQSIQALEQGPFSTAADFVHATAISALNQALYDLLARQQNIPVWKLFVDKPVRDHLQLYATINRALNDRSNEDYLETVGAAVAQGFTQIKCAPFEHVTRNGDNQPAEAQTGLERLRLLRGHWPALSIRVDCHERFTQAGVMAILPEIKRFGPAWFEAPLPLGEVYKELKPQLGMVMALGELYFGTPPFLKIAHDHWAEIVMPDVKHVGGFGPLVDVAKNMPDWMEVSPHNPTGPVATAASLHAGACCANITSLEIALIRDPAQAWYIKDLKDGALPIPMTPGWGVKV